MDIKKINQIIQKSGNHFHYKVVEFLRENDWYVIVSPYYSDNFTNKPREIDIIAEKEYRIENFGDYVGSINVRFFIECKYITAETVFWFDDKDISSALERVLSDTPLEDPNRWSMTKEHRYLENTKVAKLFVTETNKNPDNEVMYKAISQSLNSMIYYRNRPSFLPTNSHKSRDIMTFLYYPLVVCNSFDNFWKYDTINKNEPEQIDDNFQLEIRYAYFDEDKKSKNEYFLLDVLAFDKFKQFIKKLETKDVAAVRKKLLWKSISS